MEANTFCACGCLAVRFCTCQKPRKLYLCNNCTNTHINKPGGHSFFDVKVNDLLDSDLYNSRTQCASQLRARIDLICELVQREQSCLGENINVVYEKECQEIFQAYQKAWNDINSVYQELLSVLGKARSEAGKLETDLKVELASETRALLQLCWHEEKEVEIILNTAEEAAKSLKLQQVKSAEAVFASWSCGDRQCSTCGQKEKELVISSVARYCQQCQEQLPPGRLICGNCVQTFLQAPNSDESPSLSARPLWKCQQCQYEYNLSGQPCTRCEEMKAKQEQWKSAQQGNANQIIPAVPNPNEWICKCGSRQTMARCSKCTGWKVASTGMGVFPSQPVSQSNPSYPAELQSSRSNLLVFPAKKPPSPPHPSMWKCHSCSISNLMDSDLCIGCNKSRWRNAMTFEASVIMGRWGWVCPTCFIEQPVETNTCRSCGQLSPVGAVLVQRRRAPS